MGQSGNPAKRAESAAPAEPVKYDPTPLDADGVEDFDAFWNDQDRKHATVRIAGHVLELPPSLPLRFELEAKRLRKSKDADDIRHLVATLVGSDVYESLVEGTDGAKGLDLEQFKVLLAWLPQRIAKGDDAPSLAEVQAKVREAQAKADSEPDTEDEDGDEPDPT